MHLPLKNVYCIAFATNQRPRLVGAIISEPELIMKTDNCNELKENNNTDTKNEQEKTDKSKIYFDKLRNWKGHLRCKFDITIVFDEFQDRLRDEWNDMYGNCKNTWPGIHRYFISLNEKDMEFNTVTWDRKTNRITYNSYIGPIIHEPVVEHDFSLNILDRLQQDRHKILVQIFLCSSHNDLYVFRGVCQGWNSLLIQTTNQLMYLRWVN